MKHFLGIIFCLAGALIAVYGIAIAAFADAEVLMWQLITGGGIALFGLFFAALGWLMLRSR
jgi:hypothetical protein